MKLLVVGLGGVVGAVLRYIISKIFKEVMEREHPISTLFINVAGCFFIGFLSSKHLPQGYKLFLTTGLLGGFTTYSTFMLETSMYVKKSKHKKAFVYVFLSIVFGIMAAGAGIWLANAN
ncbi:CrcB protein [Caldicellulosiruptor saccharolyticus DSM 8903]|uniref:Fluoride-specific ion channel FluC n=1 Tax=Caldicellulosiruptor saccharolyticus (strain ATCC 43494 / DSM 8903 / Tp8T 6331) TaxID=351627 RepID=A4XHA8_CALS8|nr:fluoride efflux transporter CrcB [Caldicellulosiruptor saccharolyticus]ABP66293.1 CrcB protein [Caldicellulosiruptor saccharolyticus DSM 8903]